MNWIRAWAELTGYEDIEGYRDLPWLARKKLDHRVIGCALCSWGFWRASGIVLIVYEIACILSWHWDLSGWRRDLLRAAPGLVAMPWLAAGRKRHIRAILGGPRKGAKMR